MNSAEWSELPYEAVPMFDIDEVDPTRVETPARVGPRPDPGRPVAGKVGNSHPSTARRAAVLAAPKIGSQKAAVLSALREAGPRGLTAAEAALVIGRSRNQTAARLLELREDGWAAYARDDAGRFVERPTDDQGNTGRVHVAALDGASPP